MAKNSLPPVGMKRRDVIKSALSSLTAATLAACGGGGGGNEAKGVEPDPAFSLAGLDQLVAGTAGNVTITNTSPVASGNWVLQAPAGVTVTPSSGSSLAAGAQVTVQVLANAAGNFTVSATLAGGRVSQSVSFTVAAAPIPNVDGRPASVPTSVAPPLWMTAGIGEWAQIAGTTAPRELRDYSGVGVRDDATGVEVFSALAGGHSGNAANNRVMTLQLDTDQPAWIERMPASDPAGTSVVRPVDAAFVSDGHPLPRHTYVDVNWVPALGVYVVGGEASGSDGTGGYPDHWGFRPDGRMSGDWLPRGTFPDRPDYRYQLSANDPETGAFFAFHNSARPGQYYQFNSRATPPTWTLHPLSGTSAAPQRGGVTFDSRRRKLFQLGGGGWFTPAAGTRSLQIDPATGQMVDIAFRPSEAWSEFQANGGAFVGSALVYNPDVDCYYFYNGNTGAPPLAGQGGRVYRIVPNDTVTWDMEFLETRGITPADEPNYSGVYNKFFYVARWQVLILVVSNRDVYYLRTGSAFRTALQVTAGTTSGLAPYSATVLPLRGEVPNGMTLVSDDEPTLRSSIVSTHDDGSAAVVVVGGRISLDAQASRLVGLRPALMADTSEAEVLVPAHIGSLVNEVSVAFGGSYGTARLTSFSAPEHVWWANERTICARYRLLAPNAGTTTLEAVVDVTAYDATAGRALVEVVIENGRIDALNSTKNGKPADASYSNATVTVNGTVAATVSSSGNPRGTHGCFRAWYAKAWIGGDPGLRATQHHEHLQRHPLFWRSARPNTADLSVYASDVYTPWSTGRHRADHMGGTGDHDSIGPLPRWEAQALQTGDRRCWQAVEVSALAVLSYDINYRDTTGFVPDASRMPSKFDQSDSQGNWPMATYDNGWATWEGAHQPAAGLTAFVGRPSPVFIEIAQKVAVWTGTRNNTPDRLRLFDSVAVGLTDMTGITPLGQTRGFAWGLRQTTHATFLSPDDTAWRAGGKVWMGRCARMGYAFQLSSLATLNLMWDGGPGQIGSDHAPEMPGKQVAPWMVHFIVGEAHKSASVRLCNAEDQTYMASFADWIARQPARWVNEQPNGGWRFCTYSMSHLDADNRPFADYAAQRSYDISGGGPSSVRGGWGGYPTNQTSWAALEGNGDDDLAGSTFNDHFWYALVAAVERDVEGAADAWQTVSTNITNLSTWLEGYAKQPRWGAWPRNL